MVKNIVKEINKSCTLCIIAIACYLWNMLLQNVIVHNVTATLAVVIGHATSWGKHFCSDPGDGLVLFHQGCNKVRERSFLFDLQINGVANFDRRKTHQTWQNSDHRERISPGLGLITVRVVMEILIV